MARVERLDRQLAQRLDELEQGIQMLKIAYDKYFNGIDPIDVKRSYRYEQGFTFELNLHGVADEARDAFVDKRDAGFAAKPGAHHSKTGG